MIRKMLFSSLIITFPALLIAQSLDFEMLAPSSNMPVGWYRSSSTSVCIDSLVKRSGKYSLLIDGENDTQSIAMTRGGLSYLGDTVCLRGYIKVGDFIGNAFVNLSLHNNIDVKYSLMDKQFTINNSSGEDWVPFELKSAIYPEVLFLKISCHTNGCGKVWLDDLSLEIDGKPISQARPKMINNTGYKSPPNKRINNKNRIKSQERLSAVQVENLNVLARVWGLLKYYHPAIVKGKYNWDYELMQIMPKIYDLSVEERNRILLKWIERFGIFKMDHDYPNEGINWINDTRRFGVEFSSKLADISISQRSPFHYYVRPMHMTIPNLYNESAYADMDYNDVSMRLLGVFRLWNAIEFFHPKRPNTDDLDTILSEAILNMSSSEINDKAAYLDVIHKLLYGINDSQIVVVDNEKAINKKLFPYGFPFKTNALVENKFIVKHSFSKLGEDNLLVNDAITHIDELSVEEIIEKYKYLFPNSNRSLLAQLVADTIPYISDKDTAIFTVDRNGEIVEVQVKAYPTNEWGEFALNYMQNIQSETTHKIYEDSVAYISLGISDVDLRKISGEYFSYPNIIIDCRDSPYSEETFKILTQLLPGTFMIARYRHVDFARPGNFIKPAKGGDYFSGSNKCNNKIVAIVNHNTTPNAEYIIMMLQNIPGVVTLGSHTPNTNGDVTGIILPGNIEVVFTGVDRFYPDENYHDAGGIRIDEVVVPTLKAIRDGRDELLERAIEILKQGK